MKKIWILFGALGLIALVISGCLLTGTVVITHVLSPDETGASIHISDLNYTESRIVVNLNEEEDFEDYRDNIDNIDNIGFYMEITNNSNTPVTFQLFLEPDISKVWTTPEMPVDSMSHLFFTGLTVPARETIVIEWSGSIEYITDLDAIKPILETGVFSVYPNVVPRDNFDVTIDSLVVVLTLTGSK